MPSAIVRVSSCSRNSSWLESTVRRSFQQAIRRSIDTGETLSRATGAYGTDKGATPASDWLAARTIDEDWDWMMIPFRSDDTGDSRRPGPSKRGTTTSWCATAKASSSPRSGQAAHPRRGPADRGQYRQAAGVAREAIVEVSYARSMWIAPSRLAGLMRARWRLVLRILLAKAAHPTHSCPDIVEMS